MSRISCDVTKDLLTVYLDDVCSEESRTLVEEHLRECPHCQSFLEAMKEADIEEACHTKQFQFFQKAKRYLDNRYKFVFALALFFTALMIIYTEAYYAHIPEIFIYVSLPILMCTFFLTQPASTNKTLKWRLLQLVSLAVSTFLIGFHLFALEQLTILLTSPTDERLWALFQTEPSYLGPALEKLYLTCVFCQIVMLVVYSMLGKKHRHSFTLGQNASWLGIGLGLAFRASLYNMDTPAGFTQNSLHIIQVLLVEFAILFLCNLLYIKKKLKKW